MGSSAKSSGVKTRIGTDGGHSVDGGRQGCGRARTHQAEQTIWAMGHLSVSVPLDARRAGLCINQHSAQRRPCQGASVEKMRRYSV